MKKKVEKMNSQPTSISHETSPPDWKGFLFIIVSVVFLVYIIGFAVDSGKPRVRTADRTALNYNDNPRMLQPAPGFVEPTPEEKAKAEKARKEREERLAKLFAKSKPIPMKLIKGSIPLIAKTSEGSTKAFAQTEVSFGRIVTIEGFCFERTIVPIDCNGACGDFFVDASRDGTHWFEFASIPPEVNTVNHFRAKFVRLTLIIDTSSKGKYEAKIANLRFYGI